MKFIVDAQLPPVLATFIQRRGHVAIHVSEVGLLEADDSPIWQRALVEGQIVVTKDEDFAIRRTLSITGPQIIWLRIGNCSNNALLPWFGSVWTGVERQLLAGDPLIEVV